MPAPAPAPPGRRLVIEPIADAYVPGVCNIGPWEVRRRMVGGIAGLAVAAAILVVLVAAGAAPITRAIVLVPVWGGSFSVLQARRRFCGAFAMQRISNFGDSTEARRSVEDEAAHRADMAALARLTRDSFLIAIAIAAVSVVLTI